MMLRRSIPLHQINAFDAAARCLSFSHAAKELNVQQPAVSRQVAALEADLGTPLFVRSKPRLTLTPEGQILADAVASGFDGIRDALNALRQSTQNEAVIISASIGFTSLYLLPRMAEFQAAFPDINLQISTRDQNEDFDPRKCDVVILFGAEGLSDAASKLIFGETMIAVSHPDLLHKREPFDLKSLAHQKLLHMSSADHKDDWNRFFSGTDIRIPAPPPHDSYVSYMVYLRAIQNGLGIGIGWRPMLYEFLANKTLALACGHECPTSRGYYCSITPNGVGKHGTAQFLDWIGREYRQ